LRERKKLQEGKNVYREEIIGEGFLPRSGLLERVVQLARYARSNAKQLRCFPPVLSTVQTCQIPKVLDLMYISAIYM